MEEIIRRIEELGYVVKILERGIEINEPFISLATSKTRMINIAMSTRQNDVKFLEEVYNNLSRKF